jgi:hypothetical protein
LLLVLGPCRRAICIRSFGPFLNTLMGIHIICFTGGYLHCGLPMLGGLPYTRIDDHSVSSNTCLHAHGAIQLPWHLMISSIAMALHSQKLGQTIQSEWSPQVMSTLQWHHHTQINLL